MWSLDYIISIITYYSSFVIISLFHSIMYFIVSKSCLERAFVTLKRIIVLRTLRACALIWCVCGARGDKILRTNEEKSLWYFRERETECVVHPTPHHVNYYY